MKKLLECTDYSYYKIMKYKHKEGSIFIAYVGRDNKQWIDLITQKSDKLKQWC